MKRINWDEYFGYFCQVASMRSDDAETKLGSVIVDKLNKVVSIGYNNTPRKTKLPKTRPQKYPYMIHAEENAILNCHSIDRLNGCRVYILKLAPCSRCAGQLCQVGIKEVIIVNQDRGKDHKNWDFEASMNMFQQSNISLRTITVPILKK